MVFIKGYKQTEQQKAKIGIANSINMKRLWQNPEYRANQIAKRVGVIPKNIDILHSPEVKAKLSAAQKLAYKKDPTCHGGYKNGLSHTPEYRVYYQNQRRARKLNAKGSHTIKEWQDLKKKHNYMCLCCKRYEPEIKLTEDHIQPLTKGGSDYINNIQPLCRSCNSRKSATWKD